MQPNARPVALCFALSFVSLAFAAESAEPARPAYPVFGILQVDPELQGKPYILEGRETFEPLRQLELIYTGDGSALRAVRDAKNQYGLDPPVIVYMGGFTTNPGGAQEVEKGYRGATGMVDVTVLAEGVDAKTAELLVEIPEDGEFPIKAGTAEVSVRNDPSRYCFWIRVDAELMKVIGVEEKTGRLIVERGFESQATPHATGARVFTPVYLGNREDLDAVRHSNSWPGGPDYLRYAIDPAADAAQKYKADLIVELMKSGYDGAWLDTFQVSTFNLCDALGRKVRYYWDFRHGRRYDPESHKTALQEMLRGIRRKVEEAVGREPVLAANSVSSSYDRGGKELFSAVDRPGLLDGYCFEDSHIRPEARRGEGRKLVATFHPVALKRWLKNMNNQRDAAREGLGALCMIGPAGYVAAYINPSQPNYDRLIRFAWCSHLLTVTKARSTRFGLPILVTRLGDRVGFLPLPDLLYRPIGDLVDRGDIDSFKAPGTECYLRRFTNGLVVVNPSETQKAESVDLPEGYVDAKTGKPARRIELAGGDAALLLRKDK
jgi:hypothetical protein